MEFYDHGNEPERDLGNDEMCGPVSAHFEVVAGLDLPTRNLTVRKHGHQKLSQNWGSLQLEGESTCLRSTGVLSNNSLLSFGFQCFQ